MSSISGVSAKIDWVTGPWNETTRAIQVASLEASKRSLRKNAQLIAKNTKPLVPVYRGSDPRAMAERGALRASVRGARRIKEVGPATFELKVGALGGKVSRKKTARSMDSLRGNGKYTNGVYRYKARGANGENSGTVRGTKLYRRKIEAKTGFMAAGLARTPSEQIRANYEAAYAVAFRKASR